jgi:hypothetical protein
VALPTPQQQAGAVQTLIPIVVDELGKLLSGSGFSLDASQVAAVLEVAVDSLCMKAWKQAHAAGQAAADAITTEAQAETAQRGP